MMDWRRTLNISCSASLLVLATGLPAVADPVPVGCQQAATIQAEREAFIEDRIAVLEAHIDAGAADDDKELRKELKGLQTRFKLLQVAERRLERGKPNSKKCDAITTFVIRVGSVS